MFLLRPISTIGPNPNKTSRGIGFALLVGVLLGTALGFFAGHYLVPPAAPPCPIAPVTPPQATPSSDGGVLTSLDGETIPDGKQADEKNKVRSLRLKIRGSLAASLAREMKEAREANILTAVLGRLLVWWLDATRDVMRDDELKILFEPVAGPGELRILALEYTSQKMGKTFSATYFEAPGASYGRYYSADGQELELRMIDGPIDDYEQVTELMNMAGRRHRGVDFKTDRGTPVISPFRARIARRNWSTRRNGNCLDLVYMDSGVHALFLHLDEILPIARPGRVVEAGTVVALAGNTGRSTAPHLHYELHKSSGRLLNPFDFHKTERLKLEGSAMSAFEIQHRALHDKLQRLGDKE